MCSLSHYNGESVSSVWKVPAALCAAILAAVCVDASVFRSGFYYRFLEPDSSAGVLQLCLLREKLAQAELKGPTVLTLGDSRMNYSVRLANLYSESKHYKFRLRHGSVAGTNPRCWYYTLRELDPTASRYHTIVIPVDDYADEDTFLNPNDYPHDIHYLASILRWSDVPEYPNTYDTKEWKLEAWRGVLFKGLALQQDMHAFLEAPSKRLAYAKLMREWWPKGSLEYEEQTKSVEGLAIDWSTRTATSLPAGADAAFQQSLKDTLLRPPAPQTGRLAGYRRRWFGKIFDHYKNSPTRFVFVMLPRGPIPRPAALVQRQSASIREMAQPPRIVLADEHLAEPLEQPVFFKDALHMNRAGSTRYGELLVEELHRLLRL